MSSPVLSPTWQARLANRFASPVLTSIDELVGLRDIALALQRSSKRRLRTVQSGAGMSKILGRGLDFAEVRAYQAGDDVRMIDWNVTARSGNAHTKLFVEEKERPFYLVIDLRSSMHFATRNMYKSMLAVRLAAMLGWCAVAQNDRVGGMVFSDHRHIEIKPQSGRRGLMALFRACEQLCQEHVDITQSGDPSNKLGEAEKATRLASQLRRLKHIVHSGSSLCLLSDFNGFDQSSESVVGNVLTGCDVVGCHIVDPLERSLPAGGQYAVADVSGLERMSISTDNANIRKHYSRRHEEHGDRIEQFLVQHRGRYLCVSTADTLSESMILLFRCTSMVKKSG